MLKKTSKNFRAFFLLQFTKEIINQYYLKNKNSLNKINTLHKISKKETHDKLLPKEKELNNKEFIEFLSKPLQTHNTKIHFKKIQQKPILRIPEPTLSPALRYLTPTPTNQQIDLEKLNPLIQDPLIQTIECEGKDQQIIVKGNIGTKKTNIILNEKEIKDIIKRFSEVAKIPIQEGIFKVVVGKLVLSSIVSQIVGTKFIITKISMYSPKN